MSKNRLGRVITYVLWKANQENKPRGNRGCLNPGEILVLLWGGLLLLLAPLAILLQGWLGDFSETSAALSVSVIVVLVEMYYLFRLANRSENRKRNLTIVTSAVVGYILLACGPSIVNSVQQDLEKRAQNQAIITNLAYSKAIYEQMGFSDVAIEYTIDYDSRYHNGYQYSISLSANCPEPLDYRRIYRAWQIMSMSKHDILLKEHGGLCDCPSSSQREYNMYLNGIHFMANNWFLMDWSHDRVYNDITIDETREMYPYVGMPEQWIEKSVLGTPEKQERCPNFWSLPTEDRYTTYTWYDEDGHFQFEAIVRYYLCDDETQKLYGDVEEIITTKSKAAELVISE